MKYKSISMLLMAAGMATSALGISGENLCTYNDGMFIYEYDNDAPYSARIVGHVIPNGIKFETLTIPSSIMTGSRHNMAVTGVDKYALKDIHADKLRFGIHSSAFLVEEFDCPAMPHVYEITECRMPEIVPYSFAGMQELEYVNVDARILGRHAFHNVYKLKYVTLGKWTQYIGAGCFNDCRQLVEITVLAPKPPEATNESFGVYPSDFPDVLQPSVRFKPERCTLKVPKGSANRYKEAAGWNLFKNIEEITDPEAGL